MTISPVSPRFGGTIYLKAADRTQGDAIKPAVWDTVLDDEYGFSPDDKTRLLKQDAWCSNLEYRGGDNGGVLYLSADNDEALASLGAKLAADTGAAVIHQPGELKQGDNSILLRSSALKEKWQTEGNETALKPRQLEALA